MSRAKPKRTVRPGSTGGDPPRVSASGPDASGGWTFAERHARLLFGAAVLVAQILLSLAVFNPAPHSGGDNAGYISLAHGLLTTGTYTEIFDPAGLPHTKYPPLFPLLLALWMLLGAKTWTALKTSALLFTTASTLFAYLWASERKGPVFGAGVALLFAISSASLDASHWILSDPPFVAFTILALWAFERSRGRPTERARAVGPAESDAATTQTGTGWIALAGLAALLAYFTRSAGLPLLVALGAWLAWQRRWRALGLFAAGAGTPVFLWWVRAQRFGAPVYVSELWMVDPYDPSLGRLSVLGLVARFGNNLLGYVTRHVPGGIVGTQASWVAALGLVLIVLAAVGWARAMQRAPGLAEIFVPLYVGLILLWPEVWSGDRFALPLYPLLFFYAGDALLAGAARAGRGAVFLTAVVAVLAVGGPASGAWTRSLSTVRQCAAFVRASGPFGCYGPGVEEFVSIALWSRTALPEGSSVLSRKPRIFYAMSGVPSRTFPFTLDPEVLFSESRATGARYLVVDQWDGQAGRYLGEIISRRPAAFCLVGGFDPTEGGVGTLLLGIVPGASEIPDAVLAPQIVLERCPPGMLGDVDAPVPAYRSSSIPILEVPDSGP